jgi:hypothetical protein
MTPPPTQSRDRSDREVWISFAIASLALVAACIVAVVVM